MLFEEIEKEIWERENIRVVFRTQRGTAPGDNNGSGYNYNNTLGDQRLVYHLARRIRKTVGKNIDYVIVRGDGKVITSKLATSSATKLGYVRKTYE